MTTNKYCLGIALIMEGDTEKYFYEEILKRICIDNQINFEKVLDEEELSYFYELTYNEQTVIVKIKNTETITQITNQYLWFKNNCSDKYNNINWYVALCYDTDGKSITAFSQFDWYSLKERICNLNNVKEIFDCAAQQDVEDLFLIDFKGILNFLNVTDNLDVTDLKGRKGKIKLKNLYTDYTSLTYHEGKRALPLICSLDLRKIIIESNNNIKRIEEIIVGILIKKEEV